MSALSDFPDFVPGQLKHTIASGRFFTLSDHEILLDIRDEFEDELDRLKRAYSVRDFELSLPTSQSPSQFLYGAEFDEINRTLVAVLALRWIYRGDYETFTGGQPVIAKLDRESFDWTRDIFLNGLSRNMDIYALVMSVIINDLGKDPQLAVDLQTVTGKDISNSNHDLILLESAKNNLVKCLDRLDILNREKIIEGMELGARFNFGQLAQAENVPACLAALKDMKNQSRAFEMRFMEQLLDIAGAAGHEDWSCARKFVNPIFQAYYNVYNAALGVISGDFSLRDGYDIILIQQGKLLSEVEFRSLDVGNPSDRALLRLLCMGRVTDVETATLYDLSLSSLENPTKDSLIHSLNLDGSVSEPAVQPTYMPAMLSKGVGTITDRNSARKKAVLQSLLRYLARVLEVSAHPAGPVSVIERNVLKTLGEIVDDDGFQEDPNILNDLPIPSDEIAEMN